MITALCTDFGRGSYEYLKFGIRKYGSADVRIYPLLVIVIYAPPLLDAFVKESTDFATWDEMVRSATGLRYRR